MDTVPQISSGTAYLFFLAMLGVVVFFLRWVYGPKGIARFGQSYYQKSVEDSVIASLRNAPVWLRMHCDYFSGYSSGFFSGNAQIDEQLSLKQEHSYRVLLLACQIAQAEKVFADKILCRALLLGALYHDIGRFSQFTRFRTFSDALSCNHGFLGSQIIARKDFFRGEKTQITRLAKTAVCLHNSYAIPVHLSDEYRLVLSGVRDADKLDIIHLMRQHLARGQTPPSAMVFNLPDISGEYSPGVLNTFSRHQLVPFSSLTVLNDFRLALCSWASDIYFPASRMILMKNNDLELIAGGLNGLEELKSRVLLDLRNRLQNLHAQREGI